MSFYYILHIPTGELIYLLKSYHLTYYCISKPPNSLFTPIKEMSYVDIQNHIDMLIKQRRLSFFINKIYTKSFLSNKEEEFLIIE